MSGLGFQRGGPLRALRELNHLPGSLLLCCLLLIACSVATIRSASLTPAGDVLPYASRQLLWAIPAVGAFLVTALSPYPRLVRRSPGLYALGLLTLALVVVVGTKVNGARSWFSLGPVRVQPSEFVKYALLLLVARALSRLGERIKTWRGLGEIGLLAGLPVGLIMLQPDLGMALTYLPLVGAPVLVAGARLRHLAALCALGLSSLPVAWLFFLKQYQKLRILAYLDAGAHASGTAYQTEQSLVAIGSGGLTGRGWMHGAHGPLGFLPERHTDFVFGVVGEDFGLIGGMIVLGLYGWLFAELARIAQAARDTEGRMIATGVLALTMCQVGVNVGMALGLCPVTGLTLPLYSYGGSSLVASMLGFGLAASVALNRTRIMAPPPAAAADLLPLRR